MLSFSCSCFIHPFTSSIPLFTKSSNLYLSFAFEFYFIPSSPFQTKVSYFPYFLVLINMGLDHHVICGQRLGFLCVCLLFLIISSWIQKGLVIEGRKTQKQSHFHQIVNEDRTILRPRIGSRPPNCERRCSSCEHCEAIQVPTNPQAQNGKKNSSKFSAIAYARLGGNSNYKPMSWKCKCGNLIFNP